LRCIGAFFDTEEAATPAPNKSGAEEGEWESF
jgi:hypothetical protein